MIRVRRIRQRLPIGRRYEVVYEPRAADSSGWRRTTRAPVGALQPLLGTGDAWSFVKAADDAWQRGERGWAVEFEESPPDQQSRCDWCYGLLTEASRRESERLALPREMSWACEACVTNKAYRAAPDGWGAPDDVWPFADL